MRIFRRKLFWSIMLFLVFFFSGCMVIAHVRMAMNPGITVSVYASCGQSGMYSMDYRNNRGEYTGDPVQLSLDAMQYYQNIQFPLNTREVDELRLSFKTTGNSAVSVQYITLQRKTASVKLMPEDILRLFTHRSAMVILQDSPSTLTFVPMNLTAAELSSEGLVSVLDDLYVPDYSIIPKALVCAASGLGVGWLVCKARAQRKKNLRAVLDNSPTA